MGQYDFIFGYVRFVGGRSRSCQQFQRLWNSSRFGQPRHNPILDYFRVGGDTPITDIWTILSIPLPQSRTCVLSISFGQCSICPRSNSMPRAWGVDAVKLDTFPASL